MAVNFITNIIEDINLKIALFFFETKIYYVNCYIDYETGNYSIADNDYLSTSCKKPAILASNDSLLDYEHLMRDLNDKNYECEHFSYDGYHPYSFKLIPNYTNDSNSLNLVLKKIGKNEELKNQYINELKKILKSDNDFDSILSTTFQKSLALFNILKNNNY